MFAYLATIEAKGFKSLRVRVTMIPKSRLLVGDDTLVLKCLARTLAYENHEVTMAVAGEEAIEKINKYPFDLVITALFIPENDSFKVLEATKDLQLMIIATKRQVTNQL